MTATFPIAEVADKLASWGQPFVVEGSLLARDSEAGRTEIEVRKLDVTTLDGYRVVEIVVVRHLMEGPRWHLTSDLLAKCNHYAGLSSAVIGDAREPPMLFTRLSVYDGDQEAVSKLHQWLMAFAAFLMPGPAALLQEGEPSFRSFLAGAPGPSPAWFGLEKSAAMVPTPGEADFARAIAFALSKGLYGSADAGGLTLEFPWDEGAVSAGFGIVQSEDDAREFLNTDMAGARRLAGRTALLQITTDEPHPLFGRGVLCRLQLPVSLPADEVPAVVNSLNRWERDWPDLVPSYGSWCADPKFPAPAFVCFVPSICAFANLPTNFVTWMGHRVYRSRKMLGELLGHDPL